MNQLKQAFGRTAFGIAAVTAAAVLGFVTLLPSFASAYGQVTARSIEMSNAQPGATGVTYKITFTETAANLIQSVDVDFCADSPLYADGCSTALTGFDASGASLVSQTGTSGWTLSGASTKHFVISGATQNSAATVSFEVSGINNPSAVGASGSATFYARIYTYAAQSNDYSNATSVGTVQSFGGVAMNIVNNVVITAKVIEQISLCASGTAYTGNNCAGASTPSLTLGHGTTVKALDSSATDTANAYTQVASNAQNGVIVRMKNGNACGGLSKDGGTTCGIAPVGAAAAAIAAGQAKFGLRIAASSTETGGSGSLTPIAPYDDVANYGMDASTANDNVTTTYGDTILSTNAPLNGVDNTLTFAASAATTTPAGVYTAAMSLIATGSF
jgi:hypothetical protein